LIKGNVYLQNPPYAEVLTGLGCNVLVIDTWAFGERSFQTEEEVFKEMIWQGKSMWGMMVFDSLKALDYLATREDVDMHRIATLGMSMGSSMSWWLAALDTRIKVCIDICCLTDFHTLLKSRSLNEHSVYYYVYDLINHFTTAEINSLIAPRAHLSLAGTRDPLTPVEGLDIIDKELKGAYKQFQASEKWRLLRYDIDHNELPEMREEVVSFLKEFLQKQALLQSGK
jgi:dienelactone hydrolase